MKSKFQAAFRGLLIGVRDKSIKIQLGCMVVALGVSLLLRVETIDLMLVWGACFLVVTAEFFNTVLEKLADLVCLAYDERVRDIKDLSAATVLIACMGALGVAVYIALKYVL